jgi:hypothetical protein
MVVVVLIDPEVTPTGIWRKLHDKELHRSGSFSVSIVTRLRDGRRGFDFWQGQ